MSSASSGLAATGVQSGQLIGHRPGLTYRARMTALPADRVSCRTPAGIHSARLGGSAHADAAVRTGRTPGAGPAVRSVGGMNENHARVCPSPEWAAHIQQDILPSLLQHADLGQDMLEIGPGPGAATEWLRHRVARLTAVEVDADAARALADKFPERTVTIVTGSATELGYPDESFDSVGTFTMLHHVPTVAQQNKILAEALRVLRPGGVLIGSARLAPAHRRALPP